MLYTDYRPDKFSRVIGQPASILLRKTVQAGGVPTAILLAGPRGCGKTTLGRLLARALNCRNVQKTKGEPCGRCAACRDSSAYWLEKDAGAYGNKGIEELDSWLMMIPRYRHNVAIIDESQGLTGKSQREMLKTLEEPPRDSTIILLTTHPEKLDEALRSRCVWYPIYGVPLPTLEKYVKWVAKKEGIRLESHAATLIARESGGSVRDALSHLEGLRVYGGKITEQMVRHVFRVIDVDDLVATIVSGDTYAALVEAEQLTSVYSSRSVLTALSYSLTEIVRSRFESGDTLDAANIMKMSAILHERRSDRVWNELAHVQSTIVEAMVLPNELSPQSKEEEGFTPSKSWDVFINKLKLWVDDGIYPPRILDEAALVATFNFNELANVVRYTTHHNDPISEELQTTFEEATDYYELDWRFERVRKGKSRGKSKRRVGSSESVTKKRRRRRR